MICDYGCGQEATYQLNNGKWCCSKSQNSCPVSRKKQSEIQKEAQNRLEVNQKRSDSLKIANKKDEVKIKRSEARKRVYENLEAKEKHRNSILESWQDPDVRKNILEGINKPEVKEKQSRTSKEFWQDENIRKNILQGMNKPEVKEAKKQRMLNGGAAHMISFISNPSKPQVKTYENAKLLYEDAILNYPLEIKKGLWYSLDTAILSIKLDIEYDGSYWHEGKEEHDKKRDQELKKHGWKVLRYKDYVPTLEQLKKDIEDLVL